VLVDVTVREWLQWSTWRRHIHKLFRVGVDDFPTAPDEALPIDPYFLGVLIGDGSLKQGVRFTKPDPEMAALAAEQAEIHGLRVRVESGRCPTYHLVGRRGPGGNALHDTLCSLGLAVGSPVKRIPALYLRAGRKHREMLLAGLLDTDGSLSRGGVYDYISASDGLAKDVAFIARSLGLHAAERRQEKWCQTGAGGLYSRLCISGEMDMLPLRIERKRARPRRQKKIPGRTSFEVTEAGEGDYCGFTLDGDGRYLLDDFTVTHNCGKTVVFAKVAEHVLARPDAKRVLVLAHREELLDQAQEKFESWTNLRTGVEQGDRRASRDDEVVIGSVQSVVRRLNRFEPGEFDLVVIDEAHHAPADTYQRILAHLTPKLLLGVTATPDRLDRKALGATFDAVAYQYEMKEAIKDGWLARIVQKKAIIENLDLRAVRTTAGDLNEGDLEGALLQGDVLRDMCKAIVEASGQRKTLVFATTIAHAQAMNQALVSLGVRTTTVNGQDSAEFRAHELGLFRSGAKQYMVNCMLFTEGFDQPDIGAISVARPTKSRALYQQMVGRGTRIWCPRGCVVTCTHEERKRDVVVLDFAGNAGKHVLVNVADILGGAEDPDVRARVEAKVKAKAGADVMDAINEAQQELAEFYRRQALESAKRVSEHTIRWVEINPFQRVGGILGVAPVAGRWGGVEATDKQRAMLQGAGIGKDLDVQKLDRGQAAAIITGIIQRREKGLCTYKQARVLAKNGYNPDVSFEEASKQLDEIAAAQGWGK